MQNSASCWLTTLLWAIMAIVTLNDSAVIDYEDDDPTMSTSFYYARLVIVCATMVTFVWGFVGNLLVLYVVGRHGNVRVKSVANYYIWNMAMADILYVLALPLTGFVTHTDSWPFRGRIGTITCKLAYVFRETTRYTSIYTLAALTVDRCLASYPSQRRLRKISCGKAVCAVVWICSLIATAPLIIFAKAITYKNESGRSTRCVIAWPKNGTETADLVYIIPWTAFDNLFGFVVPTVVISVSYFRLFRRLRQLSAAAHDGSGASAGVKRPRPVNNDVITDVRANERVLPSPAVAGAASRRGRMTRTVSAAVLTHITLQLPYQVTQIISLERTVRLMTGEMAFSTVGAHVFLWGSAVAQILVFVSSCCNPVIYGIMNDNFKQLYVTALCPSIVCRRSRPPQISDNQQPTATATARIPIGSGQRHHNEFPVAAHLTVKDAQAATKTILRKASGTVVAGSGRKITSDGGSAGGGISNSRIQFRIFCHSPCTPSVAKRKTFQLKTVEAVDDVIDDVSCRGSSESSAIPWPHSDVASTLM